jgi:NRPS condensation-like uncharacterized protein
MLDKQGGARGVHLYLRAYNLFINDIIVKDSIKYRMLFDIFTTIPKEH